VSTAGERTLILGRSGQIGQALVALGPLLGDVVALGRAETDFETPHALRSVIQELRPQAIIIAAAYTAVDRAESEPERAMAVNAHAPAVIAEEAERVGACVVYYSTDYVFDGSGSDAWRESDATGPLSVYGRSKLAGEQAVANARRHLTFRTSWVVSPVGTNFVRTMLRLAAERSELRVVDDQVGAPTNASRIAEVTATVLREMRAASADDSRWGTYHVASAGETTWYGVARAVLARAAARGMPLRCNPDAVVPIPTSAYPTAAVRPLNSRLSTARVQATFGVRMPDWTDEIASTVDHLCSGIQQ
jgi:dTDP-4-dehydrorhamnose reductase